MKNLFIYIYNILYIQNTFAFLEDGRKCFERNIENFLSYSLNLNQWIVINYPVAYLALINSTKKGRIFEY